MRHVLVACLTLVAGSAQAQVRQPCAPASVAIEAPAPAPAKAKKAGPRVTFDRKSADVRALLVALGEVGHKNVVLSDAVGGSVTMKVEHLPWDEALKAVLAARHLEMEAQGNIIRIGTAAEFEADHRAERERAEALW